MYDFFLTRPKKQEKKAEKHTFFSLAIAYSKIFRTFAAQFR